MSHGKRVKVILVDPWDVVTTNAGEHSARILQRAVNQTSMLLEVDSPIKLKGAEYQYFIASPRHENASLEQLYRGEQLSCNLTGIPDDRANSTTPFDLSWWRGGAALIADLSLK